MILQSNFNLKAVKVTRFFIINNQETLNKVPISVETAAHVVTRVWYRTFFDKEPPDNSVDG